ncbi:MAG: VanW family protein [bacterium]|nr:VanW family protein [bacterium]
MEDLLLLPPPSGKKEERRVLKNRVIGVVFGLLVFVGGTGTLYSALAGRLGGDTEVLRANFVLEPELNDQENIANKIAEVLPPNAPSKTLIRTSEAPTTLTLAVQKNNQLVTVLVDGKSNSEQSLDDLGISFQPQGAGSHVDLTLDRTKWNSFLEQLAQEVSVPSVNSDLLWTQDNGWSIHQGVAGRTLNSSHLALALDRLTRQLESQQTNLTLQLTTTSLKSSAGEEDALIQDQLHHIQRLVEIPIVVRIGNEDHILDMNTQKDFIRIDEHGVSLNETLVRSWLQELEKGAYRETNTIRITGKNEVRPGIFKAITDGEFLEGQRISSDEIYKDLVAMLDDNAVEERVITAKVFEIPLKVYSELEGEDYDLLSVGYSEYSHGNAPNRVHNVKNGLALINGSLIEPGAEISFNKNLGNDWSNFLMGWGIFGTVAKPVLGGGLCQVSTTFYRSIAWLGVPVTMRQPHSWDLSYYRQGGYGLDATVYPAEGLDVKAINDYGSHLFFYSYTRPETEEAFVLVYGKKDGRKVNLFPDEEYIPKNGAKTIWWTQTIEYPDGEVKENRIESRYRS